MRRLTILLVVVLVVLGNLSFGANGNLGAGKGADGSESKPWLIEDFADFQAFCGDTSKWAVGVNTRLEADIDLDPDLQGREVYSQAPIGGDSDSGSNFDGVAFEGIFDGNDHVISYLTVDGSYYCGMFGKINSDGIVTNLKVINLSVKGIDYVGGLVGYQYGGIITNCYSSGVVSSVSNSYSFAGGLVGNQREGVITNCYSTGTVSVSTTSDEANSFAGGLVGSQGWNGTISNCYSSVEVVSTSDLSSNAGGLVGSTGGTIFNCYSTGTVSSISKANSYAVDSCAGGLVGSTGGTIFNCYSTGTVSSFSSTRRNTYSMSGGLAGWQTGGTIDNCHSSGAVSSKSSSTSGFSTSYAGGLIGEMQYGGSATAKVSNSYSVGSISSSGDESNIGGLVGSKEYAHRIINCFWDVESSGVGIAGSSNYGAIGKTTVQMQDITTFLNAGWDFVGESENGTEDIWIMYEGSYPQLIWANVTETILTLTSGSNGSIMDVSGYYEQNEIVTLTAVPDSGYQVKSWYGTDNDNIKSNINTVTMTEDTSVSVEFEQIPVSQYSLQLSVVGGNGQISNAAGVYEQNEMIYLTAYPSSGYQVKAWHGTDNDNITFNTNTVTMTEDKNVSVEFEPVVVVKEYGSFNIDLMKIKAGKSRSESLDALLLKVSNIDIFENDIAGGVLYSIVAGESEELIFSETVYLDNIRKDKCNVKLGDNSYKFDFKKKIFQFSGKNIDLTGLCSPVKIVLENDNIEQTAVAYDNDALASGGSIDVINGKNTVPISLMSGVEDSLIVEKIKFKLGNKDNTDTLSVQGQFTLKDENVDFSDKDIVIAYGDFTITLNSSNIQRSGTKKVYIYKNPKGQKENLVSMKLDIEKCKFSISLKKVDIGEQGGNANFNLSW